MSEVKPFSLPFVIPPSERKATRIIAGAAFYERWAMKPGSYGRSITDERWSELLKALHNAVEKGYFVMNMEGQLVLTEAGAFREEARYKKGK